MSIERIEGINPVKSVSDKVFHDEVLQQENKPVSKEDEKHWNDLFIQLFTNFINNFSSQKNELIKHDLKEIKNTTAHLMSIIPIESTKTKIVQIDVYSTALLKIKHLAHDFSKAIPRLDISSTSIAKVLKFLSDEFKAFWLEQCDSYRTLKSHLEANKVDLLENFKAGKDITSNIDKKISYHKQIKDIENFISSCKNSELSDLTYVDPKAYAHKEVKKDLVASLSEAIKDFETVDQLSQFDEKMKKILRESRALMLTKTEIQEMTKEIYGNYVLNINLKIRTRVTEKIHELPIQSEIDKYDSKVNEEVAKLTNMTKDLEEQIGKLDANRQSGKVAKLTAELKNIKNSQAYDTQWKIKEDAIMESINFRSTNVQQIENDLINLEREKLSDLLQFCTKNSNC